MVALLNGFGGGASMVVGSAEFLKASALGQTIPTPTGTVMQLSLIIGAVTLSGSVVAYAKLQELMSGRPITYAGQQFVNALIFVAIVGLAGWQISTEVPLLAPFSLLVALSLLIGVLLVMPIGGADIPVVVSLLNSYSGVAAAFAGFVTRQPLLIVVGALVGASGLILTQIMCKAMNRSLGNVLLGGMGGEDAVAEDARDYKNIKSSGPEEIAMLLDGATSCIFVPGCGLAVAQAQHVVKELADLLQKRGCQVRYAIHPVAGRMPGHMNVLLAESDVPYEQLWEMDRINGDFKNTDIVIVVGANDVVNPAAREPTGPIAGMSILDVDQARTCVVVKRSLSPGYAGIKNPLFELDNTLMVFMDAKEALEGMVKEVKDL
jgi:NAD(P) transhydrogenase subunit beta